MRVLNCLFAVLLIALLALPACAYLSLSGPTGTGNLPTAEIAKPSLDVAFDSDKTAAGSIQSWRAAFGFSNRLEVSADYVSTSRLTKGAAAKYLVGENKYFKLPGKLAVGAVYGTTSSLVIDEAPKVRGEGPPGPVMVLNRVNTWQGYVANTVTLMPYNGKCGVLGTIGLNCTDMSFVPAVGRGFASLEVKSGDFCLAADIQSRNSTIESNSMTSLALRYARPNGLGAEIGWSNSMGMLGSKVTRFFGGASYSISLK